MKLIPNDNLPSIRNVLIPHLSRSSEALGVHSNLPNSRDSHVQFFTDEEVSCVQYARHKKSSTDYHAFSVEPLTGALLDDVVTTISKQGVNEIKFSTFDSSLETDIIDAFGRVCYESFHSSNYFIASCASFFRKDTVDYVKKTTLPSTDYQYCALQEDDAELINDLWEYKDNDSLSHIKELIRGFPSVGITFKGRLVVWMLSHDYGALGILHTLEDHRGKGLAKCCVMKLISDLEKNSQNIVPPFSYIHVENEISKKLHLALQFEINPMLLIGFQLRKVKDTTSYCAIA